MKSLIRIGIFCLSLLATAQYKITGTVSDNRGEPIMGANVYLEGTYDGTITNAEGKFVFTSSETGIQTLIVSYLSYLDFSTVSRNFRIKKFKDHLNGKCKYLRCGHAINRNF